MTQGECMVMLAVAGRMYGRDISDGLVEGWTEFMADITAEEGVRAVKQHITESHMFPTVADVRRRVAESRVDAVDVGAAWGEVRKAISRWGYNRVPTWASPAVAHAVEALGWREICMTLVNDVPTLRAQFERYYRAYLDGARREANSGALEAHTQAERRGQVAAGAALAGLLEQPQAKAANEAKVLRFRAQDEKGGAW